MEIADIIRRAREARGMSLAELGRLVGVSRQTVNDWETGRTAPKRTRAPKVAEVLGIPLSTLAGDTSQINVAFTDNESQGTKRVPLLDWVDAGRGSEVVAARILEFAQDFVQVDHPVSERTFALEIRGDSMEEDFSEGDRIIVDPTIQPRSGDYVVAEILSNGRREGEGDVTFKEYRSRGLVNGSTIFDLIPLNPSYPTVTINKNHPGRIIGVVIEHRRRLRD